MSTLPEVHRPACATCGNPMDEHWRGRPCLTESEEPMIDTTKQRAECARLLNVTERATEATVAHWHLKRMLRDSVKAHLEAMDEIDERQASFDLRWKADMRAIKAWQAAHPGKERTWPDHADLCVWLMDEIERLREHVQRLGMQALSEGSEMQIIFAQKEAITKLREAGEVLADLVISAPLPREASDEQRNRWREACRVFEEGE